MDFFGVGPLEFLVIIVVALLVLGPRQLPQLAFRLGNLINQARSAIAQARESVAVEVQDSTLSSRTFLDDGPVDKENGNPQPRS